MGYFVMDSLYCVVDSLSADAYTEPAAPIDIEFTILNVYCFEDSTGDVSAEISGGTGPYTWFWDFPIADTTLFIDSLPANGYVLNVVDSNMCTYAETAVVTQNLQGHLTVCLCRCTAFVLWILRMVH